jgi:serine phosphatase RsbU (regulator of sigma subunit)
MPQTNKTKKTHFKGSLARRAFLISLALLILPLLIHSFLLYAREIRLEEALIRTDLKALGAQTAQKITAQIHTDWELLAGDAGALPRKTIDLPPSAPARFAQIDPSKDILLVGIAISDTHALVTEHSLSSLLALPAEPSFPIDLSLQPLPQDQWQEAFPLPDTNLTLTAGTSKQRIYDLKTSHLLFRIGSFLLIVVVIGGGAVYFLLWKTYRPLNALRLTMERVSDGAIHSRYTPHLWGFELNAIGNYFNETLDAVLRHQAATETEKIAREKLARELQLGHQIQASLLPRALPSLHTLDIGTGCLPAKEVGGDFYDIFPLPSGKCLILVADLAGKGISACLFSLGLRSSLRALATTTDDLSHIVSKANDLFLLDAKETGEFATLWIGLLDARTLHYISLGHPPTLLKRSGQVVELSTHHPALGLMPLDALQPAHRALEEGDELLLYSDGVTEAHNPTQELYGLQRLKTAFLNTQGLTAQNSADKLLQDVERFSAGASQHDDLTLLLIRCQ